MEEHRTAVVGRSPDVSHLYCLGQVQKLLSSSSVPPAHDRLRSRGGDDIFNYATAGAYLYFSSKDSHVYTSVGGISNTPQLSKDPANARCLAVCNTPS